LASKSSMNDCGIKEFNSILFALRFFVLGKHAYRNS
jgi:hypothetical protein